jgi:hypothetical protein
MPTMNPPKLTIPRSCRNASPTQASYTRRIQAADRIQALLTDFPPLEIPPMPLIPYAIGLSLTVAYRCIRSPSTSNPSEQKAALTTRSKMLESLAPYWWTADAMALLGRKALKSLQNTQGVGVRRGEVDAVASALEGEVSVCKHGPFEGKEDPSPNPNVASTSNTSANSNANPSSDGGLHVLSAAAASRTQQQPQQQQQQQQYVQPNSRSANSTSMTPRSTSTYAATPHKYDNSLCGLNNASYSASNSATHTEAFPTPLTEPLATPQHSSHHHLPNPHAQGPQQQQQQSSSLSVSIGDPSGANNALGGLGEYDPQMFAKFDDEAFTANFDQLDGFFDGFFDLSIPTMTFAHHDRGGWDVSAWGAVDGAADMDWMDGGFQQSSGGQGQQGGGGQSQHGQGQQGQAGNGSVYPEM